ncbi:hypothetical protein K474DRAFT_1774926 [Panus rudis PR-1116 ss-1]|nr:hypothetical protein K474DRAFT_1774926 [Panus rudis PR-1116 ss-1]
MDYLNSKASKGKKKKTKGVKKSQGKKKGSSSRTPFSTYSGLYDFYCDTGYDSDEMWERSGNCGFTEFEAMELYSQGVKPWDDDAGDVLAALSGDYW